MDGGYHLKFPITLLYIDVKDLYLLKIKKVLQAK